MGINQLPQFTKKVLSVIPADAMIAITKPSPTSLRHSIKCLVLVWIMVLLDDIGIDADKFWD